MILVMFLPVVTAAVVIVTAPIPPEATAYANQGQQDENDFQVFHR